MVLHEEGFIACCTLCDSYFVLVSGHVAPAGFRGRQGTKELDERNEQLQDRWATKRCLLLRCPTCVELLSQLPYLDWLEAHARDTSTLTPLSPCWLVAFEDGQPPPLYMDHKPAGEVGKPKWRLASGVGPAGLELDNSRSGRLWKPSLRGLPNVDTTRYEASDAARALMKASKAVHGKQPVAAAAPEADGASAAPLEFHADVVQRVETALVQSDEPDALARALHAARPLFVRQNWERVAERVDALVAAHEQAAAETARLSDAERRRREQQEELARRERELELRLVELQ